MMAGVKFSKKAQERHLHKTHAYTFTMSQRDLCYLNQISTNQQLVQLVLLAASCSMNNTKTTASKGVRSTVNKQSTF